MKVKIAKMYDKTKSIESRINPNTEKNQFNARDVLTKLKSTLPADAFCLIGVCNTDLYPK